MASITTRAGKGTPLTNAEVDANFSNLNTAKLETDFSPLTDAGLLDGTELVPVNKTGAKRTTVQKILDWIKTQAITWAAKQTISGDLEFSGGARRITADFSNGTIASRTLFQTSTLNGLTLLGVLPNGTGSASQCQYYNSADTTNTSQLNVGVDAGQTFIQSSRQGAGAFLPINFITSGVGRMLITAAGNVEHTNFTRLGESSPAIKVKKLTGTTGAAEGSESTVAHGLTLSKILAITAYVETLTARVAPGHAPSSGQSEIQYGIRANATDAVIALSQTDSGNLLSRPFAIFITYEE